MSKISEREIALYGGGNFPDLVDYLDGREVIDQPWVNTQTVTPVSAQFSLIPSSILAGTLAKGTTSTNTNGGVQVAALAGAVGTAAATAITDTYGNILNLVDIRDSTTNDPIVDSSNRKVWGLLQCSNAAADGAAIAANPSENLQISFVIFDSANSLTLTSVNQAIDFHSVRIFARRYQATLMKKAGSRDLDIISGIQGLLERVFVVTTAYIANEVINLTSGDGSTAGRSTPTGDATLLPSSAPLFIANGKVAGFRNGVRMSKSGTKLGVIWDSTNTCHFPFAMDIGEEFMIIAPSSY